jgi:glucokinase
MTREKGSICVGIDLGGTSVQVGLVTLEGKLVVCEQFPTLVERGHEAIIDEMAQRAVQLWEKEGFSADSIRGVGVGSPGPLDPETGIVLVTPNLKWENVPLKAMLVDRLSMQVAVDNDAVSATFGEWWVGAGKPYRDVVGLTLGTGVGGGIVLNGHIHHGFQGIGGHIGHMVIKAEGRLCPCGNKGCLEAYASGTAIAERTHEALAGDEATVLRRLDQPLTARTVYEAALKGDPLAHRIFDRTAFYLAVGINNILNILNPQAVVIMGAVANAGELLFHPLLSHLEKMAFARIYQETQILQGRLGEKAGVVGAAGLIARPLDGMMG